jgi:hypothetical protein
VIRLNLQNMVIWCLCDCKLLKMGLCPTKFFILIRWNWWRCDRQPQCTSICFVTSKGFANIFYLYTKNICLIFFIIQPTRCTNFSNLFWNETLHVSDNSSVHHQELFTLHSSAAHVIQIAFEQQQDQDRTAVLT